MKATAIYVGSAVLLVGTLKVLYWVVVFADAFMNGAAP